VDQNLVRLSKFLASAGVASRRNVDKIIKEGRVSVNNIVTVDAFFRVLPHKDCVTVDNKNIQYQIGYKYIALYKPAGYLSDLVGSGNRKLARALLNDKERLFPVGRLDYQSEGLMLFTNDGEFAHRVMHPRYETEKEYLAKVKGKLELSDLLRAVEGLHLEGERYAFDRIMLVGAERQNAWYRIVVHEGKNRMIRKVAEAMGHPVLRLLRVRIGTIELGSMKPGESRYLAREEVAQLRCERPSS
jgi:23S rRNA pseudouridine2605 synthase